MQIIDIFNQTSIPNKELKRYENEGFLVIKNILTSEGASRIRKDVMHIMDIISIGDSKLKQTGQYLSDTDLAYFIQSDQMQLIASTLMRGKAHLYLPFTAVKSANGGGNFDFHQDGQYTPTKGPSVNLWVALNDMTIDNGCLYMDPHSHINGVLPANILEDGHKQIKYNTSNTVPVEVKAGDCIAFNRLTVHGSGKNNTDIHRVAYAIQFHRADTMIFKNEEWYLHSERPDLEVIQPNREITK
ncbi:MAG: hypothetical protein COA79_03760 [Planctomycetota bacterium]|nr:MAG: hypothetical protein COA79_03760 [Planctomycetota bacterium]